MFEVGDVVQLRSGGAPLTVTEVEVRNAWLIATTVSYGGLTQEVKAPPAAFKHYSGPLIPAMGPLSYTQAHARARLLDSRPDNG